MRTTGIASPSDPIASWASVRPRSRPPARSIRRRASRGSGRSSSRVPLGPPRAAAGRISPAMIVRAVMRPAPVGTGGAERPFRARSIPRTGSLPLEPSSADLGWRCLAMPPTGMPAASQSTAVRRVRRTKRRRGPGREASPWWLACAGLIRMPTVMPPATTRSATRQEPIRSERRSVRGSAPSVGVEVVELHAAAAAPTVSVRVSASRILTKHGSPRFFGGPGTVPGDRGPASGARLDRTIGTDWLQPCAPRATPRLQGCCSDATRHHARPRRPCAPCRRRCPRSSPPRGWPARASR